MRGLKPPSNPAPSESTPSLQSGANGPGGRPPRGVLIDIALSAIVPWMLYKFSKAYISPSEFTALMMASTYPIAKSIFHVVNRHILDPVSILVLLGLTASAIALLAAGSPRILLIRESLFTGVFGLACFASLLLPRPMMFYFGRHFIAGPNPKARQGYDASWALPEVRFTNRLITIVWGAVYLGEFALRVVLVYTAPAQVVLVVSPIVLGVITLLTIGWTFRYAHTLRERARPKLAKMLARDPTNG
jgi:hypothetical protein